jgi:hypothetical protein
MWEILFWNTNPDEGNDDCDMGLDFVSPERAKDAWSILRNYSAQAAIMSLKLQRLGPVRFMQLIEWGPDARARSSVIEELKHDWQKRADDYITQFSRAALREYAMQQGMGLGVAAYNDAMGWGE